MSTFKITHDQQSPYTITGSHNTWIMKAGVIIESNGNGIYEASSLEHNTYVINGDLEGDGASNAGLRLEGGHATATVSKTGKVFGDLSVVLIGDHADLTNNGYIQGSGDGVSFRGDQSNLVNTGFIQSINGAAVSIGKADEFVLENDGEITGFQAIVSDADKLTIKLGKHSDISADDVAIKTQTMEGETAHITNKGTLAAGGNLFSLAIEGGIGREVIHNSGKIDGSISLGGGRDHYDGRGGSVSGIISGGANDDFYQLSNRHDYVHEATGEGYDTMEVSFSYTIPENEAIEQVILTGKGKLSLHGNDVTNALGGNDGNNRIYGEGGADALAGFGGKDFLTGGDGADMFVFIAKSDKEIVTDYVDGVDKLTFGDVKGFHSVNDVIKHHAEQHGHNLVISGDGTEMIIRNFDKADLDASDFVF